MVPLPQAKARCQHHKSRTACVRAAALPVVLSAMPVISTEGSSDADQWRYVLCPFEGAAPAVGTPLGRLSVFAASVTKRWHNNPVLRAALLWEDHLGWTAHWSQFGKTRPDAPFEAKVGSLDFSEATRQTGISQGDFEAPARRQQVLARYAKCFGSPLPEQAVVSARFGAGGGRHLPAGNASWNPCSLRRYVNGELQHEFVQCHAPGAAQHWRSGPGPPRRIHFHLGLGVSLPGNPRDDPGAALHVELCRVEQPLLEASFCTMPLYGHAALQQELPWAVEDWLSYHLDFVGFQRGEIYDVDGSFASAVRARSRKGRGGISYHGQWPRALSQRMADMSQQYPSCSETWAYAHCLTTHRALSRWVMILHSPDEYVAVGTNTSPGALLPALRSLGRAGEEDDMVSFLRVSAFSWARGGPHAVEEPSTRGSVLKASRLRGRQSYLFTPVLDPAACVCTGPHQCYASTTAGTWGGSMVTVDPGELCVQHYVEMLHRDRGRCNQVPLNGGCDIEDDSMVWLAQLLEHAPRFQARPALWG